jgi:glycosyltransferase involved in cell wall biosynthesis
MPGDDWLRWFLMAHHVPADGIGGGIARYTLELARALATRDDLRLVVAARRDAAPLFQALGRTVEIDHGADWPTVLRSAREVAGLHPRRAEIDVVHGTKHLVPYRSGPHRVLTVHDMLLFDRPCDYSLGKRWLLPIPYRTSLRRADTVVCVSEATRRRLHASLPEVAGRAHVVPSAPSSSLTHVVARRVEALDGRSFALVVGDASPRKNLALLGRIWPAVRRQHPDAVLAVVGTGASAFHDVPGIVAPGRVDDGQLRWCYEQCVVALCPSIVEGFGLPAVEALALGAPVITSMDAALREVTAGQADHVAWDDDLGWVTAVVAHFERATRTSRTPRPRTWEEVADELVCATRHDLARRSAGTTRPE